MPRPNWNAPKGWRKWRDLFHSESTSLGLGISAMLMYRGFQGKRYIPINKETWKDLHRITRIYQHMKEIEKNPDPSYYESMLEMVFGCPADQIKYDPEKDVRKRFDPDELDEFGQPKEPS